MDYKITQGDLVAMATEVEGSNVKQHFSEGEFQRQLRETICNGSLDFDTWTSLITHIEKYCLDDIDTISLVYDSFLSNFPLCHAYWKNYADHKTRLCTVDEAVEIYERAVQSATYCVSMWVDYCTFSIAAFEDPSDIRRLFKRGMSFVGKDYLCHTLWDKYIEFECSQNEWSSLLRIMIQSLRFPTKKLHNYYDNFKKFAAILEEESECLNSSCMEVQAEVLPCVAINMSETDIDYIIKNMQDPSNVSQGSEALQNFLATGEQFYHKACQLEEKIYHFETSIGRPFFHMKPLNDNHLASWHSYLDFIEKQEDFDWTVKIYEKCFIPCANYPEFWMRYVEFMESKGGRELSKFGLERATQIFLVNAPVIHIFNARFREQIGDVHGARAAYLYGDKDLNVCFVENVIKAANMEKRLGNLAAASSIYENALNLASERQKLHTVPLLYINYSRLKHLAAGRADSAIDVMLDGIEHVPNCRLLLEELLKLLMMHEGSKYMTVVDSIIANAITSRPDASQSLSTKDKEELSCLFLEYIDLCGTNDDVRKAWKRHIKLFPHLLRTTTSNSNPNATHQLLDMAMEARKMMPLNQLPKGHGSGHLIQIPVEEQELSTPENNGFLPDQVVAENLPNEDGNGAQKEQLSLKNELLSRENVAEVESKQKFLHQSDDDVSGAMESTQGMARNPRIDESELIKFTDGSAKQSEQSASGSEELIQEVEQSTVLIIPSESLQQSSSSSDIHKMEENELEKYPKPIHSVKVSSSSWEKESHDISTLELQEHGVAQKSLFSDGQITEFGPSEEIHVTSIAKSSPPTNSASTKNNFQNDDPVNFSSSTSYQNPTQTKTECEVPANGGKNCPQYSFSTPGGTSPELHEHSHSHGLGQHDDLQEQCSTDKTPHVSVVNANQGGNQYLSEAAPGNVTGHSRSEKYVENPSYVSAPLSELSPQPVIFHPQTSEQHGLTQNSQEYNQMLQYQLQQQQQQQMLLHQQYQNQMLQLQNQYFQLQQQNQQPYKQQNQPPHQIQHHHYIQQAQQLQQPSYQLEQQQYLFYQQQQQQMLQQLHPGQQEQCTQMLGQEHQTQLQQHNYQSEENFRQHNEQGYQLQLQQYQVQQQQAYQQFLLQNQAQQQQLIASTSTGNYPQGEGLIPLCDEDAAGLSENHKYTSPEGKGEPQNTVKCRPSSHRASRTANTSLSPTLSDQSLPSQSKG